MKKRILKIIFSVAAVCAVGCSILLSACSRKTTLLEENIVEDKYDNYYEIFVQSFCDSDGDGCGDLNGVTQKLDYIRDLGYTGIWLMPIHPSPSYHGYDVMDYLGVSPRYGTIEDYENLVSAAHEKGIKVIIDLVVNHTSSEHPWFKAALAGDAKYSSYYTFSTKAQEGYHQKNGKWYESWFDAGMPDLKLSNQSVRDEIENIMKFWLEKGTDGFRLDGVKYYTYPSTNDGIEFCGWLQTTAEKYNENAYLVGENWSGRGNIAEFYESGMDSFFYFDTAGTVTAAINTNSATEMWVLMKRCSESAGEYVPAPFLSNHDNGVGRFTGRVGRDAEKAKFGYGLLSMMTGSTFTYYGDEIGMVARNGNNDQDLRVGMLWDNDKTNLTVPPSGASADYSYIFDGVKEQLADADSILNYYKVCNNARNAIPAIMRGKTERISYDDESVLKLKKIYNGQTVTVVINFATENKTVEGVEGTLAQGICVTGKISQSGSTLKMPKYSIAILT